MAIEVGSTIPEGSFKTVEFTPELESAAACGVPSGVSTADWAGKKVVLVGVPGAFTPTCHANHLPPFLTSLSELKGKGVDLIYVVATNDVFVMSAWGRALGLNDKIGALADAGWLEAAGLTQDLSKVGFGTRAKRFAAVIDDGKVTYLGIDAGALEKSTADAVLAAL